MDTVFALATGTVPSAIAVIRLSGSLVPTIVSGFAGALPPARMAVYRTFRDPETADILDRGLLLYFPAPESFTGEDCAEFQVHGSQAVIERFTRTLSALEGVRMAEPGEFTRRAVANGRMSVIDAEGLSDLIHAETELQRRQAVRLERGILTRHMQDFREALIGYRALVEADLDFSDEDDASGIALEPVWSAAKEKIAELEQMLSRSWKAEKLRTGLSVVLIGPPNVGKSSLLNRLAGSDYAIVTDIAGTTRDIVSVRLEVAGVPVELSDTAGLRSNAALIEAEGIRRAEEKARDADLLLIMGAPDVGWPDLSFAPERSIRIQNKSDLGQTSARSADCISVSAKTGEGMDELEGLLGVHVRELAGLSEHVVISRQRHREALERAIRALQDAVDGRDQPLEIRSAMLREATDALSALIGDTGIEDVLDRLFSEFCIGK